MNYQMKTKKKLLSKPPIKLHWKSTEEVLKYNKNEEYRTLENYALEVLLQ